MIVVCGEALVDFTPVDHTDGAAYVPRPGGSPYNVTIGLSRLGINAAYLGRLSNDAFGRMLRKNLMDNRADDSLIIECDDPTTLAFVHLSDGREPEFVFYNNGTADRNLLPQHLPRQLPPDTKAIHFGSISSVLEPSASTIERFVRREMNNRVISFDPNVRPAMMPSREEYVRRVEKLIALSNIVKVSVADLGWLYPSASIESVASSWLEKGPDWVVITLGQDGAAAFSLKDEVRCSGRAANIVDTVGAGDAFTSGLLARLNQKGLLEASRLAAVSNDEMLDALRFANTAASLTCEHHGANPPTTKELEAHAQ